MSNFRDWVTPKGYWKEISSNAIKNLSYPVFSLRKVLRDAFVEFNIQHLDTCCYPIAAINATATATAAQIHSGVITSTSAVATGITLPTATLLGTELKATQGESFQFVVDNSAGANIVTIIVGSGIVVPTTIVITGSATLTVAAGQVGIFKLYFKSATTATLFRIS